MLNWRAGLALIVASTLSTSSGGAYPANHRRVVFPLSTSANHRYLVDSRGKPFPILGRASWLVLSLPRPAYERYLDDTVAKGFNTIEIMAAFRIADGRSPPFNGEHQAPFLRRLDGARWNGALHYNAIDREAPDFTTPNETYWRFVDRFLDACAARGILVMLFPAYVGYHDSEQGWMNEMVANGPRRMRDYGGWIAQRYEDRKNIVWMLGGDRGTPPFSFDPAQSSVEQAFIKGLTGVDGASRHRSAEWSGPTATAQPDFESYITLDGAYGPTPAAFARQAYDHTPTRPAFLLEEPYDEEGPDGNRRNEQYATQPVRRFEWWGWLNSIGGYVAGNGYVWPFRPVYTAHLNSPNTLDLARLNRFIRSIDWQDLVPDDGTLILKGRGPLDALDYVAAAATPDGKLLVAYAGPASHEPFTVNMTKMRGPIRATWLNPTNGLYEPGGDYPNTGARDFKVPGNNGSGHSDWVLLLASR